jgi:hypothetical protein
MRTKTLLCLAALTAAGVATSMAQSNVYSLNVVGYANVTIKGSSAYNLVSNPFKNANDNITNLFSTGIPDGSTIIRWDPVNTDLSTDTYGYTTSTHQWLKNGGPDANGFTLKAGEGVFFIADPSAPDITNTFVGDVIQGPYTNSILGSSAYNIPASSVPLGGNFTNSVAGLVPADGDTLVRWDVAATDLAGDSVTWTTSGGGSWIPSATLNINIAIGEGFIYVSDPSATSSNWVRNYSVPQTP